ncbi:MAG: NAD(P)-binding domain-containing protein [bacterium]
MQTNIRATERIHTVVVGGGQAGLSAGYHLARRGIPFVILESSARVGDVWRNRWDSLRLFTPAWLDSLPGMPFPAPGRSFPTKDEMADYLEAYVAHFKLPVRTGARVDRVWRKDNRYYVDVGSMRYEADNVVIAMASYQAPRVPAYAQKLDPEIVQLHSKDYRNDSQLKRGGVLVVGAGNSGAEIAIETVRKGHATWLAGRDPGQIPFRIDSTVGKYVMAPLVLRFVFHRVLTLDTPMGRKAHAKMTAGGAPLIRQKAKDLLNAGIVRVPKVTGTVHGRPLLEGGAVLDVANVIWCTGFDPGFSWIDLPVFNENGRPRHDRGVVAGEPGLFFVGLHFLYALSSTMIHGVERDADRIAGLIARNPSTQQAVKPAGRMLANAG